MILLVTVEEAQEWHLFKDKGGPTFSGSLPWLRYMEFLEAKLSEYGVINFIRNRWTYDRWYRYFLENLCYA